MGKSRKELNKSLLLFNSRASTTWSKDDSKFGQRMLEKMGWKKGEGLGLHHQGITDNLKLRLKLDAKGLGFKLKDDQWLQVEQGFSSVLSKLKEQVDTNPENCKSSETKSLESKSLKSKSRVHYHKYTRGKDVSRYNDEDLIGILGQSRKRRLEENAENDELTDVECAKRKLIDGELSKQESNFSPLDIMLTDQDACKEICDEENEYDEFAESPLAVSHEIPSNNVFLSERSVQKKPKNSRKTRAEFSSSVEKDWTKKKSKDSKEKQKETSLQIEDDPSFCVRSERSKAPRILDPNSCSNQNDCEESERNNLETFSTALSFENYSDRVLLSEYEMKSSRIKSKDNKRKRMKVSLPINNNPTLSLQKKSDQPTSESNFSSSEFVLTKQNDCKETDDEQNNYNEFTGSNSVIPLENCRNNASSSEYKMRNTEKKSENIKNNSIEISLPSNDDLLFQLSDGSPSLHQPRKLTKHERIIAKSRILKQLQLGTTNHEFIGSNLTKINGYGNEDGIQTT